MPSSAGFESPGSAALVVRTGGLGQSFMRRQSFMVVLQLRIVIDL